MTKSDLINSVDKAAKLSKRAAGDCVDAMFEHLGRTIKKDKLFLMPGFGTFTVGPRKARKGRNPQAGAVITIRARRTLGFKPASSLKKSL